MIVNMTILQAFKAMICFLEDYYNKTLSDDVGSLLGDIQLLDDDKGTWDPAAWNDWLAVLGGKQSLSDKEGFCAMSNFLHAYYERTSSASTDIKNLLDEMRIDINKISTDSSL